MTNRKGDPQALRCPYCESTDLVTRKLKGGYRCRHCKETFSTPYVLAAKRRSTNKNRGDVAGTVKIGRGYALW